MSHEQAYDEPSGAVSRWLGWLTSPTTLYLLAFVMTTGLALCLFNPTWGSEALAWPHQVFTVDGHFVWEVATAKAATLLGALACFVIVLLMRPARIRGAIALFGCGLALVAFQVPPEHLPYWILPLACAAVGGCLLWSGESRARRATLLVAFLILAANLFMPWDETRIGRKNLRGGYHSTATAQIDLLLNPPEEYMVEVDADDTTTNTPIKGYVRIVLMTVPQTVGLLMFLLGLCSLAGFGSAWVRWVAAPGLLLLVLGPAWVLYDHGTMTILKTGPEPWQLGLQYLGQVWPSHGSAWALPLAGAIAELVRPQDA